MTSTNTQTIREIYEHWAQGDFRAGPEHFDPSVVFVMRPEFPDAGTYLGPDQVAEYMRGFLAAWNHATIEATEIIEAGDSVVAAVTQRALGTASGIETELRYFHAWSFRGQTIIRLESIMAREEALAVVGLQA
jgi:ketosteroid isomerase-like protein